VRVKTKKAKVTRGELIRLEGRVLEGGTKTNQRGKD